jgi:enediyne biosynthesis protein E4
MKRGVPQDVSLAGTVCRDGAKASLPAPETAIRNQPREVCARMGLLRIPRGAATSAQVLCGLLIMAIAAVGRPARDAAANKTKEAQGIHFTDITRTAGLHFLHNNGAFGKKYLPETMSAGVAFIDYDHDGWPDIFLVNGEDWPGHKRGRSTPALYHNNHDGTFTDVTQRAGLATEMYSMGAAVGDYNNDGNDDLLITGLGQNHLFRNDGNGAFTDVTRQAGLWGPNEFSSSAAWVDYDRDGYLDLIVANYVQWSPENDLYCTLDGKTKSYCTPESYKGTSVRLWHNRGDGTFEDVTRRAGLFDPTSKSLGIAILDANQDGWPDILISNDTQPNKLYINQRNGTFKEQGISSGIAFSEDGVARSGMGVDAADYDGSGYPSLLITNFSNQMLSLYHNEGNGLFVDQAPRSEIGRASLLTLGFGCFFFDYDLDGWPDIFVANGHIESGIERVQARVKYAEPPHLFRNTGRGSFEEVTQAAGLTVPRVARGAAYADIDNDGDLDILISTSGGAPVLLRNDGGTNHGLRVRLVGTRSNRDGIGTVVRVTAGARTQAQMLRSGSSYLSASELVLTFGLGANTLAEAMEVRWPSGQIDKLSRIAADQVITIKEGQGIIEHQALKPRRSVAHE